MRPAGVCAAAVLAGCLCFGQEICGLQKLRPKPEASAALDEISAAVGFDPGTILLYASSDARVRAKGGAMSLVCPVPVGNGEERWIVYDPTLIQGELPRDFVLAHETAHHINYQPQSPGEWNKQQELDADRFGSEYLTRLGWPGEKLLQALGSLGLPRASVSGYPTLDERRAAVIKGFEDESARLGGGGAGRGTEPSIPPPDPRAGARLNPVDGLTYIYILPGTFVMGCSLGDNECDGNERPSHNVTITKGFWIGQTEVTQEAYQRVMNNNPSGFTGPRLPVENVSWAAADAYCRKIGYRLPWEAEWEYAARARDQRSRYGGIASIAWNENNSGGRTHEAGQKTPNRWGLYDMLGNDWEWVAGWYATYPSGPVTDPHGPASGGRHVLRGGSWGSPLWNVRASHRLVADPTGALSGDLGFRCAGD